MTRYRTWYGILTDAYMLEDLEQKHQRLKPFGYLALQAYIIGGKGTGSCCSNGQLSRECSLTINTFIIIIIFGHYGKMS